MTAVVADKLVPVAPYTCRACGTIRTWAWARLGLCEMCGNDRVQRDLCGGLGAEAPRTPAPPLTGIGAPPLEPARPKGGGWL